MLLDVSPTANSNGGLMDSCWPMKSQNLRHTGLSPYNSVDNDGFVKWKYESYDWIEDGIVIDDEGILYFGDFDYYLYAMYPNGSLKWRFKTDGWIWSTPALASDGTVYIGSFGDYLYAINTNGTLKWRFWAGRTASISTSSPAISKDGTIIFGAMGPNPEPGDDRGRIYALYPNGTEKWHYDTGYWICSSPAIADDGTSYIGSADYYFYAMNPDGSLKWRFKTGDIVKSHPAIGMDDIVYFTSYDNYFYALNPDGSLKWKYYGVGDASAGAAIDEEGIIYVGGRGISALYPNGTLKWEYTFGGDLNSHHSSPTISADGTIYIGVSTEEMYAGYIYAINSDGTLKWQKKIANYECTSSPVIDTNGNVYIGSSSRNSGDGEPYGELYAFGIQDQPNPPTITGPLIGKTGEICEYKIITNDYQGDDVEYYVNWGDGDNTGWIGPFQSSMYVNVNHTWESKDTYTIKAKARDVNGYESEWSTLKVIIPKVYINSPIVELLMKIVKCFSLFEKILNQIE